MVTMDVPAGVRDAHQDMVSAIDRAISASKQYTQAMTAWEAAAPAEKAAINNRALLAKPRVS